MDKKVKIVFMGTASFAVPSLELLMNSGYEIAAVVTAPDKPAGRGKRLSASPVKNFALENKLYLLQPVNLKDEDFISELRSLRPDIQIVVAFRMLPKSVWEIPALGTFNLHSSLLPQYRGAAPINHAIINGETQTGVTTFFIDEKIDTGRIILQDKTTIEPTENAGELHDKLMEMGARLVLKTVEAITSETSVVKDQDELIPHMAELKSAPKIFKEDCKISWDRPVLKVYNFIRGMSPMPGAFCFLQMKNGKTLNLKIFSTVMHTSNHDGKPGSFSSDGKNIFFIYCKNGSLELKEVQLEGKKRMSTRDFLRGFKMEEILEII